MVIELFELSKYSGLSTLNKLHLCTVYRILHNFMETWKDTANDKFYGLQKTEGLTDDIVKHSLLP